MECTPSQQETTQSKSKHRNKDREMNSSNPEWWGWWMKSEGCLQLHCEPPQQNNTRCPKQTAEAQSRHWAREKWFQQSWCETMKQLVPRWKKVRIGAVQHCDRGDRWTSIVCHNKGDHQSWRKAGHWNRSNGQIRHRIRMIGCAPTTHRMTNTWKRQIRDSQWENETDPKRAGSLEATESSLSHRNRRLRLQSYTSWPGWVGTRCIHTQTRLVRESETIERNKKPERETETEHSDGQNDHMKVKWKQTEETEVQEARE